MKKWKITGWDGTMIIMNASMPGSMSPNEIKATLQRLASRHLSYEEIISSSLRRKYNGYSPLLDDITHGKSITVGTNPYFIADLESK